MNIRNSYQYNQKRTKKRRKLPRIALSVFIIFLIFFIIKNTVTLDSPGLGTSNQTVVTQSVIAQEEIPYDFSKIVFPGEGQSAIGTLKHGLIATSSTQEQVAPIASMTKVITALAILKKAPIEDGTSGDVITLTAQDEQYYHDYVAVQGTITPVTAGLEMNVVEALQAILLPSSNNMADTLVDRYFGSKQEYIDYANQMLRDFGLQYTTIADASGFNPASVSTPSEMLVIAQKALENRVIAAIVAQPDANISVAGGIINYNPLITEPGVTGIKPGVTDEAGLCLLFSADSVNILGEKETIIGVVMGIRDRSIYYNETKSLLDQAKSLILAEPLSPLP